MPNISRLIAWAAPVRTAFVGSLLLSLIARMSGSINRDGMLYVDVARLFMEGGFGAAREVFNWPFLPILMATVSHLTGLGLENAGYLLNAFFMAGACALLVSCASQKSPAAAWTICLVTLAIPGLNEYRNELLREYGCWFFVLLAVWLAQRWSERPRWPGALAVQAAIIGAILFRPEAAAIYPAVFAWQLFSAPKGESLNRLLMIAAIPATFAVLFSVFYLSGQISDGNRLVGDVSRFNLEKFNLKAQSLGMPLHDYARDQARTILFFGSLAIIPVKFVNKIGIFIVPLLFVFCGQHFRTLVTRYPLFAWGFVAHLLVLAVFVLDLQFLSGRYVGLLYLLAAPFIGTGLWLLMQQFPRWRIPMVAIAVAIMLANVVSLGPGKTQFVEAGAWLAANVSESPRIYNESGRTAYYAGWQRLKAAPPKDRSELAAALAEGKYDLVVLEVSRKEVPIEPWLEQAGLKVVKRFTHPNKDAVIVAAPESDQASSKDSNTGRRR